MIPGDESVFEFLWQRCSALCKVVDDSPGGLCKSPDREKIFYSCEIQVLRNILHAPCRVMGENCVSPNHCLMTLIAATELLTEGCYFYVGFMFAGGDRTRRENRERPYYLSVRANFLLGTTRVLQRV